MGHWETRDQINAAKVWAAKEYVDTKRIGLWGWSYGGFMSSKVVEADAGVHSLAIAVAVGEFGPLTTWPVLTLLVQPVTSWRLYGRSSASPCPLSSLIYPV